MCQKAHLKLEVLGFEPGLSSTGEKSLLLSWSCDDVNYSAPALYIDRCIRDLKEIGRTLPFFFEGTDARLPSKMDW
jgi:hypothetical protein